ncbi:MAG: N-acetylglucosaminyl-diphospho-decaprenol L-rhamnosyltransferase [Planctomycetota bacterium]
MDRPLGTYRTQKDLKLSPFQVRFRSVRVLVSIVNYRTASLVVDCLRSLAPEVARASQLDVVVVDNESGDNSVETLAAAIQSEGWSSWARVQASGHNGGFSFGNNIAIRDALASASPPDYVLLLNPDTRVRENAIEELVKFMEADPKVGLAGSRLEDPDGTQQHSLFRFFTLRGELEAGARLGLISRFCQEQIVVYPLDTSLEEAEPYEIEWPAGASMLIRREVFEDVGLMDEDYFLYFEETDFCLAAHRSGWTSWYVPKSRVIHLVGQATGVTSDCISTRRMPRYWFESRRRFFTKNHGLLYALMADVAAIVGYSLYQWKRTFLRRPNIDPQRFVRDMIAYNLNPAPRDTPRFTAVSKEREEQRRAA